MVLADCYYGSYWTLAGLGQRGIDYVGRQHHRRKTDFRRGQRVGREDHVVVWPKPVKPAWMEHASYAALPHLVQIALNAKGPINSSFFQLPACIEIARRTGRGPALPPPLSGAYTKGLSQLHDCAFRHAADDWDQDMVLCVSAALGAAKGQVKVADAILNLNEDIIDHVLAGDL